MASGFDDMERQIDAWAEQVHAKAARYQELKQDLTGISGSAEGGRGAVRVRVNSAGVLTALELSENTRTMPANHLAQTIMNTMRKAQATLGIQVTELMRERVGDDARSIAAVSEQYARQFPNPDDADTAASRTDADDDEPQDPFLRPFREPRHGAW